MFDLSEELSCGNLTSENKATKTHENRNFQFFTAKSSLLAFIYLDDRVYSGLLRFLNKIEVKQ